MTNAPNRVALNSYYTMRAISTELLKERKGTLKFLLNDSAIAFFPAAQQHRDMKLEGLSYEDDYRGNALAGVVTPGRVEIRFHRAFSDERVRGIWSCALSIPEVASAGLGRLYYQGREIT
jgi:hypothetical protein